MCTTLLLCDALAFTSEYVYNPTMGWLRLVGSLKQQVSFAKEPYKRDYILQKKPIIWRNLLMVATAYSAMHSRWPLCNNIVRCEWVCHFENTFIRVFREEGKEAETSGQIAIFGDFNLMHSAGTSYICNHIKLNFATCTYICVYVYICIHIHICTYIYVYIYMYICIHSHICTYINIHLQAFVCRYMCMYTYTQTNTYLYTYINLHVYKYIFTGSCL